MICCCGCSFQKLDCLLLFVDDAVVADEVMKGEKSAKGGWSLSGGDGDDGAAPYDGGDGVAAVAAVLVVLLSMILLLLSKC